MLFIFFIILTIFIGSRLNNKNIEVTSGSINYQLFKTKIVKIKKEIVEGVVINTEENIEKTKEDINFIKYDTPNNDSFKSYMDYRTLSDKTSLQYDLQQQAYTDSLTGIRMVNNRYLIAVGSYYTTEIGVYLDVILKNGTVIQCILGDVKNDKHTDSTNRQNPNGSVIEFIVDVNILNSVVKQQGDISYVNEDFEGEIDSIYVYYDK